MKKFRDGLGCPDFSCLVQLGLLLLLLSGCARPTMGVAIDPAEQEAVTASFLKWQKEQRQCPDSLDAAVTVTLRAWLRSGTLSGFVQVREPAFLNFVALNPLGQPAIMLSADGDWFRLVLVPETIVYEGSVEAAAFEQYTPEGARADRVFFWLTGSVPPEIAPVATVTRDERQAAYWLVLTEGRWRHRILFDPQLEVLRRHQVLDSRGNVLVDVQYGDHQPLAGHPADFCQVPGAITVETRRHRGRMVIELSDWLAAPHLQPDDFYLEPPAGYEQIQVH